MDGRQKRLIGTSFNLGIKWKLKQLDTAINLRSIIFDQSGKIGFLAGYYPDKSQEFQGYRSQNGGKDWTKINVPQGNYTAQDICLDSVATIVIAITAGGNIYRSIDSGQIGSEAHLD